MIERLSKLMPYLIFILLFAQQPMLKADCTGPSSVQLKVATFNLPSGVSQPSFKVSVSHIDGPNVTSVSAAANGIVDLGPLAPGAYAAEVSADQIHVSVIIDVPCNSNKVLQEIPVDLANLSPELALPQLSQTDWEAFLSDAIDTYLETIKGTDVHALDSFVTAVTYYDTEYACESANPGWECDPVAVSGATKYYKSRFIQATPTPTPGTYGLNVKKSGTGYGLVTAMDASINCGTVCYNTYAQGKVVTLNAMPNTNYIFESWTGDADCSDGVVTMNANKTCTAVFSFPSATYTIAIKVVGSGTVSGAGLNCADNTGVCSAKYPGGQIGLAVAPKTGYKFSSYSPECGNGLIVVDSSKICTVTFISTTTATPTPTPTPAPKNTRGFVYNKTTGLWVNLLSNQSGTWAPGWDAFPMNLNSDSNQDVFLYNKTNGNWVEALDNGAGGFSYLYAPAPWAGGWTLSPGKFNGDGLDDLFFYNKSTGQWAFGFGNGAGNFTFVYGNVVWATGWEVRVGKFNTDSFDDIFLYNSSNGSAVLVLTDGKGGVAYKYLAWAGGWTSLSVVDLDGNGVSDIFVYNPATGAWVQVLNLAGTISYPSGTWGANWMVTVGNFNADTKQDLFLYNKANGQQIFAYSNGAGGFTYSTLGTWATGFSVFAQEINLNYVTDLLVYNPVTGAYSNVVVSPTAAPSITGGTWGKDFQVYIRK